MRVLAFKDSPAELHKSMAKEMQYTQISRVCGTGPSFFVMGPVTKLSGDRTNISTVYPSDRDQSSSWPPIGEIKVKNSAVVEEDTTKTQVFMGGRVCRRAPEAIHRRNEAPVQRVVWLGHAPITRGNQWDMSKQGKGRDTGKGKGGDKHQGKKK